MPPAMAESGLTLRVERSQPEGWFEMDDWNMNPERGKPWRLYVVVGILALVAIVTVVAYVVFHVAPSN